MTAGATQEGSPIDDHDAIPGTVSPEALLGLLRSRRVVRDYAPGPVDEEQLRMILEAGTWATSASNNRVHRFLVVRDASRMSLVKAMAPGIYSLPGAMIVICTDLRVVARAQLQLDKDNSIWIDVGTAAMNMMIEAHALGLGTCPATSFSRSGVGVTLGLPEHARPDFVLQVGHRRDTGPRPVLPGSSDRRRLARFVYWETYGRADPEAPLAQTS
jgi:albonoursin synthase